MSEHTEVGDTNYTSLTKCIGLTIVCIHIIYTHIHSDTDINSFGEQEQEEQEED